MANVEFAQVVSHGCGMDIHKEVVVATVRTTESQEARESKAFTSSLAEMGEWLKSLEVAHVAMESTGVYWKPIYNVQESYIPNIWIVNARHIKNVPGHKTDKMDSEWICKLLMAGLLRNSFIPPKSQRELRDLTRYKRKLIQSVSADKNRVIRVLEDGNIKLSSVLSSTSGVTAEKLISLLCSGRQITMDDVLSVYHKRIQASPDDILEACTGTLTRHQIFMLQLIQSNISSTKEKIAVLDQQIRMMLEPYDNVLEALAEIPGIERKVAEDLVAEIGLDMGKFPSEKHLASWGGICPGNNESAGKKSSRTNHGNKQTKAVITETAWAASRTNNTFFSEKYHRIAARRGKKRALIAIGHAQLVAVYIILSTGATYKELGDMYVPARVKAKRTGYLTKELQKLGYKVSFDKAETNHRQTKV